MEQATPFLPVERDPQLWEMAKKRAGFKYHLANYLLVNAFLWALWYFTGNPYARQMPWPIYSTLGWGIGVCFHFLGVYVFPNRSLVEVEYKKLISQNEIHKSNKNL